MTIAEIDHATAKRICNGNEEAFDWMQLGRIYCHQIDDLIDEDLPKAERLRGAARACRIGALALELYTHPFFMKHWRELKTEMLRNTGNYAESVAWEESPHEWQRSFSDWARHGFIDVCLMIAQICGGYDHRMALAQELRTVSYIDHHSAGQPT